MRHAGEADYLITYDGNEYPLHEMARRGLLSISGLGEIPVDYQTSRGYKQDGITVLDYRLDQRVITFRVADRAMCRDDYWDGRRRDLLDTLRMNRGGPLVYRKVKPDGERRDIKGWLQSGPQVQNDQGTPDRLGYQPSFTLLCPDPTFYNPTLTSSALGGTAVQELVFPITFDDDGIIFGSGSTLGGTITYTGTWRSYPTFLITGPYTSLTISNATIGASFTLSTERIDSEQIIVDLTPGDQKITNVAGTILDEVPGAGSLIDWYLAPDPEATDGINTIDVFALGDGANTAVVVRYYTRYVAL